MIPFMFTLYIFLSHCQTGYIVPLSENAWKGKRTEIAHKKEGSADTLPKGDTATVESLSVSDVITIMKDNGRNDYHVL